MYKLLFRTQWRHTFDDRLRTSLNPKLGGVATQHLGIKIGWLMFRGIFGQLDFQLDPLIHS